MPTTIEIARGIRSNLSSGTIVRATFRKEDGSVTERRITRNQNLIPEDQHPKYVRAENPHYIVAFDLEKKGWIRFHENNILSWSEVRP